MDILQTSCSILSEYCFLVLIDHASCNQSIWIKSQRDRTIYFKLSAIFHSFSGRMNSCCKLKETSEKIYIGRSTNAMLSSKNIKEWPAVTSLIILQVNTLACALIHARVHFYREGNLIIIRVTMPLKMYIIPYRQDFLY